MKFSHYVRIKIPKYIGSIEKDKATQVFTDRLDRPLNCFVAGRINWKMEIYKLVDGRPFALTLDKKGNPVWWPTVVCPTRLMSFEIFHEFNHSDFEKVFNETQLQRFSELNDAEKALHLREWTTL